MCRCLYSASTVHICFIISTSMCSRFLLGGQYEYCVRIFEEMRILAELEDITTSVDVHRVYAKVKCTVGTIGLTNYVHR